MQQFTSIATLNKWLPTARAQLLHTFLLGSALTFFQGLPPEIQTNFNDAIAALRKEYDDSTIKNTLHIDLHNRKQGLRESVSEYCSDLESRFLRLNIAEEYYKSLVLLDGLQPHLTYEVRKTGPTTYTQAKELARNIKQHYVNKRVNQPLLFRPFLQVLLSILPTYNRHSYINKLMVCNASFNLCKPL